MWEFRFKEMKAKIIAGFFILVLSFTAIPLGKAQFEKQAFCVVMPGNRVKEKFFTDYRGERIYFCCRSCVKRFKKNPGKYWPRLHPEVLP